MFQFSGDEFITLAHSKKKMMIWMEWKRKFEIWKRKKQGKMEFLEEKMEVKFFFLFFQNRKFKFTSFPIILSLRHQSSSSNRKRREIITSRILVGIFFYFEIQNFIAWKLFEVIDIDQHNEIHFEFYVF